MTRLILRGFLARIRDARFLFLLSVLGVALGVASVLCIQILNRNAMAAFQGSMRAVSGETDFAVVGTLRTFDESAFRTVLADPGVDAAFPVARYSVAFRGQDNDFLEVVGTDLFASARSSLSEAVRDLPDQTVPTEDALREPGWVAVVPALAEERGWALGDRVAVSPGSRNATLRIGALLDLQDYAPLATRKIALMDIAAAQHLFGERGRIHQIDVRVRDGEDPEAVRERVAGELGSGYQALTLRDREMKAAGLMEAFRLNLSALSLISLFVGFFLIYSSTQTSLIRRRREFGVLRTVGATPRQVFGLILAEAILEGTLGTLIGIPLGYFAATQNVEAVSATLSNIYLLEEIERLRLTPDLLALAWAVGTAGALLGAVAPALETARRDPRALLAPVFLQREARRWAPRLAAGALATLAAAAAWFALGGREFREGGFVLGFFLLAATPLVAPQILRLVCDRIPVRSWGLRYSFRNLSLRLASSSFAVGGLAVAVSMMLGVTLLIGSFRATLQTWVETSVRADVYVATESWTRAGEAAGLDEGLVDRIASHPGVTRVESLRQIQVYRGERLIRLAGIGLAMDDAQYEMPLRAGDPATILRELRGGDAVVISEPLARKEKLGIGDELLVSGPDGEVALRVVGVSYDYSSENGAGLVSARTLERHFGAREINTVAVGLAPGVDPERTVDELKAAFSGLPLVMYSNRTLRTQIFDIFDQTFAITRILQGLALLIAVTGIALALLIRARERRGELALYRAVGGQRTQIFREFVGEGLGIGLFGVALGGIAGIGLAMILVHVINPAYFGWTIRTAWPWSSLAGQVLTILAAAVIASVYPAVRASRTPARELGMENA